MRQENGVLSVSEELASVREIVDLTPDEALNRVKTFLVGQGYRPVNRSGNSLTVERSDPNLRLKGKDLSLRDKVLTLWIAALPQPGGGIRITVRGNDRVGVHDQRSTWIEWANSLPKKAPANNTEGSTSQGPQEPEKQESDVATIEECFYSPGQVATLVSVSVHKMIEAGKLPVVVIHGKQWIPEKIADDLIRKHPRRNMNGPQSKARRFPVSKEAQISEDLGTSEADLPESLDKLEEPQSAASVLQTEREEKSA